MSTSSYYAKIQTRSLQIMKGGVVYPASQMLQITITYLQLPSQIILGQVRLSKPIITFIELITPIQKPILLKLQMSLLQILYLVLVSLTSLIYVLITSRSSCSFLYLFFGRLNAILSSSKRVTKRLAHFLLIGFLLQAPKSLLAISSTLYS